MALYSFIHINSIIILIDYYKLLYALMDVPHQNKDEPDKTNEYIIYEIVPNNEYIYLKGLFNECFCLCKYLCKITVEGLFIGLGLWTALYITQWIFK